MDRLLIKQNIEKRIGSGKAIILIGPRQVGKTTLIREILQNEEYLFFDGDDHTTRKLLKNVNTEQLRNIIGNYSYVFIDEAQRIENIGLTLKIIVDQIKIKQLFVSGSSAFEVSNYTNEPLTGRKWEYNLYPISWQELQNSIGYLQAEQQLPVRLVYGMYPDVINNKGEEAEVLKNLANSYLYKDILSLDGIRKPELLEKLLQALAYQLGSEVNYSELAQLLKVDGKTIRNYIDLLTQAFVIFRLPSFSKNLRNEIKTNQKIYFYDNGIRNSIIGNLKPMSNRTDIGALWENFLISERIKKNAYTGSWAKGYFWRTKQQQEIDYVEIEADEISAYEFKWNPNAKTKISKTFTSAYDATTHIINTENFRDFII